MGKHKNGRTDKYRKTPLRASDKFRPAPGGEQILHLFPYIKSSYRLQQRLIQRLDLLNRGIPRISRAACICVSGLCQELYILRLYDLL